METTRKDRSNQFFITVNKGAKCFDSLRSCLGLLEQPVFSAYILHDKDGAEEHFHVLLSFNKRHTAGVIMDTFEGAHVEIVSIIGSVAKYLLHRTPGSEADGKYAYDESEIITSNPRYFSTLLNQPEIEPFDPNSIELYVAEGTVTFLEFYRRFGVGINSFRGLIHEVLASITQEAQKDIALRNAERLAEQDDGLPF